MSAALANLSIAAAVLLAGIGTMLMLVGWIAYARIRHGRMLWVSVAFGLLAAQGVVAALDAYAARDDPVFPGTTLLSLGVALALYFAVLKR